jgi:hypothetical protein
LTLALDELELRYVHLDQTELIRRIFVAVRDVNWGTVPSLAENVTVDVREDALRSSMSALCRDPGHGIELHWSGSLECSAPGVVEFTFEATPTRRFPFGRIGLCVLHPPDFAGGSYRAKTPNGWIAGALERTIAPQLPGEHGFGEPLFPAFDELVLLNRDGIGVHLELSGDLFELEDQRNWADASYKTYSTPLHLGPQQATPDRTIKQRVVITPIAPSNQHRPPASTGKRRPAKASAPTIELGDATPSRLPKFGVVFTESGVNEQPIREALRELRLAHVRVDVSLDEPDWPGRLKSAAAAVQFLGTPVELAVTGAAAAGNDLDELPALVRELGLPIARVLAFRRGSTVTDPRDVVRLRRRFALVGISALVYGGTDVLFADLNGDRPDTERLNGVAFPLVPTVHADDDLSLIETTTVFQDIIRTARTFTGHLPLAVTPISLRERPRADERQSSLLAAVWALGVAAGLAVAGTESVTLFETAGPRGLLTARDPASLYPAYHLVADLCGWQDSQVVSSRVSDPLSVMCLAVRTPKGNLSAIVANGLSCVNRVELRGVPKRAFRVRRLNDEQPGVSARYPRVLREATVDHLPPLIELSPYELLRVDSVP